MKNNNVWFGYLEIGEKSTPVVKDSRLSTGNPETVYLFNLQRNQIIEYKNAIVTPKLRELTPEESDKLEKELNKAFNKARAEFTPRVSRPLNIPERASAGRKSKETEALAMETDGEEDDDFIEDDD